jgi:hypothetical protein
MKMLLKLLLLILSLLLLAAFVQARPTVLDEGQWTQQTHLWLARAMVAEAGWTSERDHVAIAYVLERRWKHIHKEYRAITFLHVIRAYCAGLMPGRRSLTDRQRWVRSLDLDITLEPEGWPKTLEWTPHSKLWKTVLDRADLWSTGSLPDPCNGEAWHWGGPMDDPEATMLRVDCGETLNTFYRVEKQNVRE